MSLVLVLLGFMGFTRLSVREYPDIDPPVVSVTTLYAGASPEVIETTITEPLEDQITSIEGIKTLTSSSSEGMSNIIVTFELDRDIDLAAQDVRDRAARARQQLPIDVEEPVIVKQDADAQPILWLGLAGEKFSQLQLTDYADRYLIDELQTIRGVGRVVIGGQREYAMRLWLDPQAMSARTITPLDVRDALQRNNIELPSGRIEGKEREFTIRTLGELKLPEDFNRLIIKTVDGIPVYLQDIGHAEISARSERSLVRMNGETAVGLGVVKQSKANTLDVAHSVKDKLESLRSKLPKGMMLKIGYDGSQSIEQSIEGVKNSLWQAIVMVTLVIFFFLGNARATLVPVVAIPISLIATFFIMDTLDYSLNTLTLLSLTLAIGLVVDDAIVVLENIYRRLEEGEPPMQAAINGMQEIGFAVIATTLVLIAIFVPLAFMGGTVGRLFAEFAIALAGAVVVSTFIALSLSPSMCAHLNLRPSETDENGELKPTWSERITAPFRSLIDAGRRTYTASLAWAISKPIQVISGSLVLLVLTGLAYVVIPKEFLPTEDNGFIMTVIRAPEGSTLNYTNKAALKAEKIYSTHPDVDRYFSVIAFSQNGTGNVNEGIMFVTLNDKASGKRSRPQSDILNDVMPQMMGIPDALVFPFARPVVLKGWGQYFLDDGFHFFHDRAE
jgi:hydrophobe/amphiphile efflux-1 (HAE1) family protein